MIRIVGFAGVSQERDQTCHVASEEWQRSRNTRVFRVFSNWNFAGFGVFAMAQLSLFDSPVALDSPLGAGVAGAAVSAGGGVVGAALGQGSTPIARLPLLPEVSPQEDGILAATQRTKTGASLRSLAMQIYEGRKAIQASSGSGVQRMGDLAKLVLQQHDLVAQRRAAASRTQGRDSQCEDCSGRG